jgi:hypothetical protein
VTSPPEKPAPVHPVRSIPEPRGNDKAAPIVYLDKAFAYGITQGIVQVELAARNNRSRFRRRHDGRGIRRHRAFALQRKRRARSHAGARGRP